ncbi:serine hydrolase domain-containing protein [Actinoplanes sp. NEAU-A12]|uniref:Serine hydrolase domain-containing protein n=1 Tax=Actinoplanes sandaracinus TaxID=3045177 RepID=A0ABT6WG66_9ACTN|nr:serine hydrolase domain-containing protein [Actinoplanes sandaracinus]MDI6098707.1 serine hydrolase domain-containing protein [Actinoplanes sandaracinus]
MKYRLLTVAMAGVLTAGGCATTSAPEAARATLAAVDRPAESGELMERLLKTDQPGCSAAVGIEGVVAWSGARGVADTTTGRPLTTTSVFDIASVSKQFTATAVLLLAGAGDLDLTDPVAKHVPGLPGWAGTVTIDHLIHHTSGITDYTHLLTAAGHTLTDPATQRQALEAIAKSPPPTSGTFAYSNSNYVLLAEVVAAVSGQSLPQFLAAKVFGPLRLAMTLVPAARGPETALPYAKSPDGTWQLAGSAWTQIGDGSVQTTPGELVRWADNYRTGAVGGETLLKAQLDRAVPTGQPAGPRYAAGIAVNSDGTLSHEGGWAGYATLFGVTADRRTAIAVSCNAAETDITAIATGLQRIWTR